MRVFLPSTLPAVAQALLAGQVGPGPLPGFAVTPALRESYASGDTEELEYAALTEAARASLRLLASASASANANPTPEPTPEPTPATRPRRPAAWYWPPISRPSTSNRIPATASPPGWS